MRKSPVTPAGRVVWPSVFRTATFQGEDSGKFELTLLFPADADLAALKQAAREAASKKFPVPPKDLRSPFHPCAENDYYEKICPGGTYIKFSSKAAPAVVGCPPSDVITEASGRFYPGCVARVSYTVYAYDNKGNRGVAFGLVNVQKIDDGEALQGGRTDVEDDFSDTLSATGTEIDF